MCEYCRLPTRGQVATFPIDHIVPKSAGGTTDPANLALTCPHCNAHKGASTEAVDPDSGAPARLFHPRQDDWGGHFRWSPAAFGLLLGATPVGRATVLALDINAPDMVQMRQLLARAGLFPEVAATHPL